MTGQKPTVYLDVVVTMTLNEKECRALDALVGYGDDAFLDAFKEGLGKHYIRDHEDGLRSFFKSVRQHALPAISQVDECRKAIAKYSKDQANEAL